MKKKLLSGIFILVALCCFSLVSAIEVNFTSSEAVSQIRIDQLKYEPYPVNPGEYFDLWIKVEKTGSDLTSDAVFELLPEYPFSLDSNERAIRSYGKITNFPDDRPIVIKYRIRVDEDAVEGTNTIELKYSADGISSSNWGRNSFDIEVADAQTDFDIVVQDVSDSEVSFAIANIGKNTANSVIIKIPEQDNFRTVGTAGQMLGNLENGDYTIASFNIAGARGSIGSDSGQPLTLQVDYTDNIGERRTLVKEVSFSSGLSSAPAGMENAGQMSGSRRTQIQTSPSIFQSSWFWAIIIIVSCISAIIIYKKYIKKRVKRKSK